MLNQCIAGSISHPLLEIEWTCIQNDDDLDETTIENLQVMALPHYYVANFIIRNPFKAKWTKLDLNNGDLKLPDEMKNFEFMLLYRVLSKVLFTLFISI